MSLVPRTALDFNDLDLAEIRKARTAYKAWQEAEPAGPGFDAAHQAWEESKAYLAFLLILKLTAFEARPRKNAGGAQ